MLQLVYCAIPKAATIHPLNALQLIGTATKKLGSPLVFTHGNYHLSDSPKTVVADIVLTRDFAEIERSYNVLWPPSSKQRYERMLSENQSAWKYDYAYRKAKPKQALEEFLNRTGAKTDGVDFAVEMASIDKLKQWNNLSYIRGKSYESDY